jgi:hypothetical protein
LLKAQLASERVAPMKKVGERGSVNRSLVDSIIAHVLEQDPDRVAHAVATVLERLKSERRFSPQEIDAAAAQVCRELGIPFSLNRKSASPECVIVNYEQSQTSNRRRR